MPRTGCSAPAPAPTGDPPRPTARKGFTLQRGVEGSEPAWTYDPGPEGRCGWHTSPRLPPRPRSAATSELGEDRAPSTAGSGGARRGLRRCTRAPQRRAQRRNRGRRRRRAAARIVQPAARAPEPGPGLSPAGAEGTIARPPPPSLPLPPPRRRCRWRAAPSPLVPSVKSSVLCLAAAIVRRGPVPCLGRRPRETEGPRGVSGCGPAGSALRRGRPGVGGGRGGGERPGAQGRGRPAS